MTKKQISTIFKADTIRPKLESVVSDLVSNETKPTNEIIQDAVGSAVWSVGLSLLSAKFSNYTGFFYRRKYI